MVGVPVPARGVGGVQGLWNRCPGDRIIWRMPFGGPRLRRVLWIPALYSIGYGDVGSSIYYALGLAAYVSYRRYKRLPLGRKAQAMPPIASDTSQ